MGRLRGLPPLAAAALLLLVGAGCGERSEPTGPDVRLYPVTVQTAADRPLVVERPARRIAVLDPPTAEIVRALGAGGRIVAPPPQVADRVDVATLRKARPDLIVAIAAADERQLAEAGRATGAQVYTAPSESIRQVEQAITQLGLLTGDPIAARGLVRRIEERRGLVARRLAGVPTVSVFVDTGFFTTVSDQSLIGDLIRGAHGRNVAGPSPEPGPIDLDRLLRLDPDVYMTTSDTGLTLADLRRNKRARKLRAVRKGHFAVVESALVQPGPRIGEGLVAVARLLHPDAFR